MTDQRFAGKNGLTRGAFLRVAAGTAAATCLALGAPVSAATDPVRTRKIPKSGEALPIVGLGTARTFDVEGSPAELAARTAVLEELIAGGGKVIDTSTSYGNAESIVGRLLADMGARDRVFLATKVSTAGGREVGVDQMQGSLRSLRTKRLDLIQVHNLKNTAVHLATMRAWRDAGKVRYIGVTHFRVGAYAKLARVMRDEDLDFVQFKYSIATREAEQRLLPLAAERGIAVLINRPYDLGRLFRAVRGRSLPPWAAEFDAATWGQFFLKYILAEPAVTCVIPGTRKAKHMADNLGAGRGALPDAAQRRRMVEFWSSL